MKKIIERIVKSDGVPNENDLWLTTGAKPELREKENGTWITISGGVNVKILVDGTCDASDGTEFIPNDGQPTFENAKACFLSGGAVLVSYKDAIERQYVESIIGYRDYIENEALVFRKTGVGVDAFWYKDSSSN